MHQEGCQLSRGAVDKKNGDNVDFWEYDYERSAWKMNHVRPRKRLYTPVGKNCPFQADQVTSERWTEWKCRGKTSFYKDDWQVSPHQRISSKSWVGSTWFFPKRNPSRRNQPMFQHVKQLELGPR